MRKLKIIFIFGILLVFGLSSAEAYSEKGGAYYMDAGDTREEGGTTAQSYSLLGRLRVDQNELPAQGPALAGAEILVEWDRDNGLAGCDRIYQANEGDILRTTASDNPDTPGDETGRFSINGLVSGKTYCITFRNKPGFNNKTYLWPTTGTGDDIDNYFVMRETVQSSPFFTVPPAGASLFIAPPDMPLDDGSGDGIHFRADDSNLDKVTLTVLGTMPPWMSKVDVRNPGQTGNGEAEIKLTGTPPSAEAGLSYPLSIYAEDAWGNSVGRPYTIQVAGATLFLDVTSTHLPPDPNRTVAADFGDIDGDGDSDLVIAHPPSASFGNRILINNHPSRPGAGKFTDDTTGRLPQLPANAWPFFAPDSDYRSFGIRLITQVPGTPPDLFLTAVGRYLVKATSDYPPLPAPDPAYPYNEIELGRYKSPDNSFDGGTGSTYIRTPSYRLKNDGTGRFPYDAGGGITSGHDPLWGAFFSMMYAPWYMEGPFTDGGYGTDIEAAMLDGNLNAFYANLLLGEPLPNNFNRQTVYIPSGESHYWGSPNCASLPCSYGVVRTRNWDTFYEPLEPDPGDPYGDYAVPQTADFEVADVDGDGDTDVFTAGFTFYGVEPMAWPPDTPIAWNHPPRLWLKRTVSPPLERFYDAGNAQRDLRAYALTNPTVRGTLFIQKAAFSDLDGDGKQDLVITDIQSGPKVLRNTRAADGHGNVSFTLMNAIAGYTPSPVNPLPLSIVAEDAKEVVLGNIVGSGLPDIVLVGNGARRIKVLRNDGNFNFTDVTTSVLPDISDDSEGGLIFDMDGDGDLDLLIYNNGQDRLYKNTSIP